MAPPSSSPRARRRVAATLIATGAVGLAGVGTAHAADGLVGAGPNGVVGSTSQVAPYLTAALGGARDVAAIDRLPTGGLLALDTAGHLGDLDARTGAFTARYSGEVALAPAADAARTLSVAPDGASALIAIPGRAVRVDLATGAVAPAALPAPSTAPAVAPAYALDTLPDGHLTGFDAANHVVVGQRAVGGPLDVLGQLPEIPAGAAAFTLAEGGDRGYGIVPASPAQRQSRLLQLDPATGVGTVDRYFLRPLTALAATGAVADVRRAPRVAVQGLDRTQTIAQVLRSGFRIDVRSDQAGQSVLSARIGDRVVGFGFSTLEVAGKGLTVEARPSARAAVRRSLRRAAAQGATVRLRLTVHGTLDKPATVIERRVRLVG